MPEGFIKEEVQFRLMADNISIGVQGFAALLEGQLYASVDPEASTWIIKNDKRFVPGKVAFISVFYRTVVVHYINTYNTYKNTYNLYSNVTKRLKRFQILKWNEYYFDTVQGTEVEFLQKKVISCLKGVNVLKISSFLHTESQGVWLRYCVISLWIATLWHVPVKLVTVSLLDLLWDICSWKWAWPRAIQETFHIKSTPVEKVTLPID